MADNITIPTTGSGTATPVVATDDISSVHYQKVKPDVGADGAAQPLIPDVTGKMACSVQGNVAADAVDSGNPVKTGKLAVAYAATPTEVAAADRSVDVASRAGIPFVHGPHPNVLTLEAAYTSAQTDTALVGSISAGTAVVVTQVQAVCDEANTVGVGIRVGFGATNTPTTTGVLLTHPGMVPGSGISRGDGMGILGIGASGDEVRVTCEVPTGGSIRVLISYFLTSI